MTRAKLKKLQRTIDSLRASRHNIRSNDLISLARSLGREKKKRGKHPTYESMVFPDLIPIPITVHPGAMSAGTAINILDDLELDVLRFSQHLDEEERKANEQHSNRQGLLEPPVRTNRDS